MKRVIDSSEVLGMVNTADGVCEICATADASYDEASGKLIVDLDSWLRKTDIRVKEQHIKTDWLPQPEKISESVGPDEMHELAREIFHRWVRKVREAAPHLHTSVY
jgi:hypothetical protein